MADALRRILWLFPVLGAGAIVIFFVLGSTSTIRTNLNHPLFYNPTPTSAQVAANAAIDGVLMGDAAASEMLRRLGGAALPVALERMAKMSVSERRKLASALRPVADRIKRGERGSFAYLSRSNGTDSTTDALDRELLFWERFRDEHALDLRPLATTRLVRRVAEREAERKSADLIAVDTYALPFLVEGLGRIANDRDVGRATRLVPIISSLTEESWTVPKEASVDEARRVVTAIRTYWDDEGGRWTQMDRLELLVARASQTEFWSWLFRVTRQVTGQDDATLIQRLTKNARPSAALAVAALLGLLVLGPLVAATIEVLQLRKSRFQFERVGFRAAFAALLVLTATWVVAREGTSWPRLLAVAALVGTASSAFILHRELSDRVDWRTHQVLRRRPRLSRVTAVVRWLAPSIPTLIPIAIAEAALLVTCLEASGRSQGVGLETLRALRLGDLDFLMAICLALGLATGTAQVVADLFLGDVRRHWREQ